MTRNFRIVTEDSPHREHSAFETKRLHALDNVRSEQLIEE